MLCCTYAATISNFIDTYKQYNNLQTRKPRKTKLFEVIHGVQNLIDSLQKSMQATSAIKISVDSGISNMMVSLKKKEELLTEVLMHCISVSNKLRETGVIGNMKKRNNQVLDKSKVNLKKYTSSQLSFKFMNTSLCWDKVYTNAECDTFNNNSKHCTHDIITIAGRVQAEFCVEVSELPTDDQHILIDILVTYFPIMLASSGEKQILLDVHKLLLDK